MYARLTFAIFFLSLTACNGTVKDFVAGARPPNFNVPGPLPANGPMTLKVSPGNVTNKGTSLSMQATVTPTDRVLKASSISAQVTLHRQRVAPQ